MGLREAGSSWALAALGVGAGLMQELGRRSITDGAEEKKEGGGGRERRRRGEIGGKTENSERQRNRKMAGTGSEEVDKAQAQSFVQCQHPLQHLPSQTAGKGPGGSPERKAEGSGRGVRCPPCMSGTRLFRSHGGSYRACDALGRWGMVCVGRGGLRCCAASTGMGVGAQVGPRPTGGQQNRDYQVPFSSDLTGSSGRRTITSLSSTVCKLRTEVSKVSG